MEIRLGNWRVTPYSGGHCWQLQKKTSEGSKMEWQWPDHYPGTLHRAVEMLVEFAVRDADGSFDIGDGKKAAEMLRGIDEMVGDSIRRIESAVKNAY